MAAEGRVRFFRHQLTVLGFHQALRATELVVTEMNREKGFCRDGDGSHYYYHCVDVAQKLLNVGVREEGIIAAALLHDLVEDVEGYSIPVISRLFGERVAHMVDLVTKKKNANYKEKETMDQYLSAISNDLGASLIKTSDRMHNFGSMLGLTMDRKMRQVLETEEFYIPFFKKCRQRYPSFAPFFFDAKTTIEPHLIEIKEHYRDVTRCAEEKKALEDALSKARIASL